MLRLEGLQKVQQEVAEWRQLALKGSETWVSLPGTLSICEEKNEYTSTGITFFFNINVFQGIETPCIINFSNDYDSPLKNIFS